MCGRFYIADDDALADMVRRLARANGMELKTGDINPGDGAAVFVREGRVKLKAMTWGFKGFDSRLIINARSESAQYKPTFASLINSNRLIVPAKAYYEWDANKQKHTFSMDGGMYMAGLYRPQENRFVILTMEAMPQFSQIHNRMPVVFGRDSALNWLDPSVSARDAFNLCESAGVSEIQAVRS